MDCAGRNSARPCRAPAVQYRYLKEIYGPRKLGRLLSFLFIWQLSFSAPLSIASGCLGFSQYASFPLCRASNIRGSRALHLGPIEVRIIFGAATLVAIGTCGVIVLLLYRGVAGDREDLQAAVGRRHGHDGVDHLRRTHAFPGVACLRFPTGCISSLQRILSRTRQRHADRRPTTSGATTTSHFLAERYAIRKRTSRVRWSSPLSSSAFCTS